MKTPIALLSLLAVLVGASACTGRTEPKKEEAAASETVTARHYIRDVQPVTPLKRKL